MTRKPAYRYTCDFCGKSMYSGGHMKSHEKHCTANPKRECRMCKLNGDTPAPMEDMIACISWSKPFGGLKDLAELTQSCPACTLSALRQARFLYPAGSPIRKPSNMGGNWKDPHEEGFTFFDFKAECNSFMETINENRSD